MKDPYFHIRKLILCLGLLFIVGPLPRYIGIIKTKYEYATIITNVDIVITVAFGISIVYAIIKIIYRAYNKK